MYHGHGGGMPKEIGPASWFIVSKKDNYILNKWKEKCDEYWINHQSAHNYFWMDELFKKLHNKNKNFRYLWSKVPYLYCEEKGSAHTLQPCNPYGGMEGSNEELKKLFTISPPYALKFWNGWNGRFKNIEADDCINSTGYHAIQMAINNFPGFKNIDPIIKIFCDNRKRVWFKYINNCTTLVENPDTYIIFTENDEQKILHGVDYLGPDLLHKPCSDLEQAKNLTFTDNTMFYFYIRGHIRNSFNTDRLKNFVKLLKLHFPNIKFILQTWKQKECKNNESWKNITECDTVISKQIIENYFKDETVTKQFLIIDEKSIELIGSTDGTIGEGPCPKIGWKNMWYGIYKGLEYLDIESSNNFIVSFRYDYFDINESTNIDEGKIIQFIIDNLDNKNIQFINYKTIGTDNLYMGKCNKIKALIEKFHFKLDDILNIDKKIFHQEFLVNTIAEQYND